MPSRPSTPSPKLPLAILFLWALPTLTAAAALPVSVEKALQQAHIPLDSVSVLVTPMQAAPGRGATKPRLSHRPGAPMNPASVMKLITSSAGLSLLGADFTWRNRVYVDGPVQGGVLQGNLILRGSGDPKLVVERVQELWAEVMRLGVREVRGDIVLDSSVFDLPPANAAGFDDEPLRPYNTAPSGLLLNFKAMIFKFTPDSLAGKANITSEPPLWQVQVPADVPMSSGPCQDWRSTLKGDFSQAGQIRFSGTYPRACGEQSWPVAFVQPETFASRMVHATWLAAGGKLSGQVREGLTPASALLLLQAPSLSLPEIVSDINKFSNNVMAQQLFLTLSSAQGLGVGQAPPGEPAARGRFEASRQRVLAWWRQHLPDQTEPVLDNGSGLSRHERSSAQALSALLQVAAQSPYAGALQNSLSVAGVDGTLSRMQERSPHSAALGQAWLKSGSLRDVAALAGYVQGQSGQRYVFVAIVNHPQAALARPALDRLLEWTVQDKARH